MTRAPIKLSREMKLLLLLLLMVALIGAWYVWTSSRAAGELAQQGAAPAPTGPAGASPAQGNAAETSPETASTEGGGPTAADSRPTGAEPSSTQTGTPPVPGAVNGGAASDQEGAAAVTLAVQPNRPVEVEVIPPFPAPQADGPGVEATAAPGGINPQASVAAVPRNNPFRPLGLDNPPGGPSAITASDNSGTDAGNAAISAAPLPRPDTAETTIPTGFSNAGPLALSPIPGAGGSTQVTSGSVSGLPTIPGADGGAGLNSAGTALAIPGGGLAGSAGPGTVSGSAPGRTISGSSGDSNVTVIGGTGAAGTGTMGTGTAGMGRVGAGRADNAAPDNVVLTIPKLPKPIPPPIAGVSVPGVNRVPVSPARTAQPGAASGDNGSNGTSAASRPPTPGTPQVITALGQLALGRGAADAGAAAPSPLDQFVQGRQLAFNAAVLGPVNTAIFRGQDGYMVVAVGQNLPDSQVTLREVSADSAVLGLGSDLKTLELDQR